MKVSKFVTMGALAALALFASAAQAQTKICIDPGHGGTDPGAVGGGYEEQERVLDNSVKLKAWFDTDTGDGAGGGSWSVYRTRTSDTTVSLSARSTYANGIPAARFMSIHDNAFNSSANGIETFSHTSNGATSNDLRNKVYEEAVAMWPLVRRGTKQANYAVLRETNMAAELHEQAFIDSSIDRVYITNSTHQNNQAKSSLWALQRHYGLAKYTPGGAVVVTVDNASGGFSASANWYTGSSTPGYYGSNYHVHPTEAVSDAATFTANLPSAGTYKVEVIYTSGANRAAAAPYIVDASTGSVTVNVNQQANGGAWQNLGNYSFGSGANTVRQSCWTTAGYYVIADAVRFTKQ